MVVSAANKEEVDKLITTCELSRQMQELIGNYIMMEEYFMHEMVTKVRGAAIIHNLTAFCINQLGGVMHNLRSVYLL